MAPPAEKLQRNFNGVWGLSAQAPEGMFTAMSAQLFTVVGSKGGVGKSMVAFYTAYALTKKGGSAVVLDLDLGFRCQSVFFGVESDVVYDLSDLMKAQTVEIDRAIKKCSFQDRLFLIPSCADPFTRLSFDKLSAVCSALRSRFDYVVLDAPPSVSRGFIAAITLADSAVVVTTPDRTAVKSASLCAQITGKAGAKSQRLIINKVPESPKPPPVISNFDSIIDETGIQLVGVVPQFEGLDRFAQTAKLPNPKSTFMLAFENIARRLNGEDVPLLIG